MRIAPPTTLPNTLAIYIILAVTLLSLFFFLLQLLEDVQWFQPVELRTKHGLKGNIKEPLGICLSAVCCMLGTSYDVVNNG